MRGFGGGDQKVKIETLSDLLTVLKGDRGDEGHQGPPGLRGDTGERGPKGDTGSKGDKGDRGIPGEDGADGRDGLPGERGPKGEDGRDGRDGSDGEQGPRGLPGEKGEQGLTGPMGLIGEQGVQGLEGIPGEKGETGSKGDPGKDGINGKPGKDAVFSTWVEFKEVNADTSTPEAQVIFSAPLDKAEDITLKLFLVGKGIESNTSYRCNKLFTLDNKRKTIDEDDLIKVKRSHDGITCFLNIDDKGYSVLATSPAGGMRWRGQVEEYKV